MKDIKLINAIASFTFGANNVNRGEDNTQKYIPQLNRNYISGDKIIYCVNETVRELNNNDTQKGDTYVSKGDKRSEDIKNDIASDLNGYMDVKGKGNQSSKRTGVFNTGITISMNKRSELNNFKMKFNSDSNGSPLPINETLSVTDTYIIPFQINRVANISYIENNGYVNSIEERKRRINLYLNGFINLKGLACQHTLLTNNIASYVKYVISSTNNTPILSLNQYSETDLMRFNANNEIINYLVEKGEAKIFEGGINPITGEKCIMNVFEAMENAQKFIIENNIETYDTKQ